MAYVGPDGKSLGFFRYQERGRKKTKQLYASFCRGNWVDGKSKSETVWLGKVIDKEDNIFKSRERGIYRFTPPDIFAHIAADEAEYYQIAAPGSYSTEVKNTTSVVFGSIYLVFEVIKKCGLLEIFKKAFGFLGDTAIALILYKLTDCGASMHVKAWWERSYAKYIFPDVNLTSQNISKILVSMGKEECWRTFFEDYSRFVKERSPLLCALIDSTGLPNDIDIALTQTSNHGEEINRCIRLIVVLDQKSGYPLYFKYIPGNIVDKITLVNIFNEMDAYDIDIVTTILDAGYYSESNLMFMYD
jgi:hypothetical protein